MKAGLIIIPVAGALLSGCIVGPDYKGPPQQQKEGWVRGDIERQQSLTAPIDSRWWENFNDPDLTWLLTMAARKNHSVRLAVASIERARGAWDAAQSGFFPTVSGSGSFSRMRRSENSTLGQFPGIDPITETWEAGFDASWELNLFGRTRRRIETAEALLAASVFEKRDALLSVQAETARLYMELRAAQEMTRIAINQAKLQEQTAHLVAALFKEGQASEYELSRIRSLVQNTRAQIPQARARSKAALYALSFLTDSAPEEMTNLLQSDHQLPVFKDPVRIGLKSELLQRRPDIRQAERILAARTSEVGAAMANLFPSISLTGGFGFESQQPQDLFRSASRTWLINPAIHLPIFNRGELRAQIAIAEADQKIALITYEQTVARAFRDAQEALTTYAEHLDALAMQRKALAETERMVELAAVRYRSGEDDLMDLSDAQEQHLQAEQRIVSTKLTTLASLISLYKALGGGWIPHNSGPSPNDIKGKRE